MRLFAWLRSKESGSRGLGSKVLGVHDRSALDGEMDEELRSHMEHRADDLERTGVSRAEAERRARVEFGGYVRFKEESHEAAGGRFAETLMEDVRFGFRMLWKSPNFTIVAVVTLALAIGANAVVFSLLNGLVLKPLNVPQGRELYTIERGKDNSPLQSYRDYVDLRDRSQNFAGVASYDMSPAGLDTGGGAAPVWLYEASGNYFDVLDVKPYLGRFFHGSDEHGPNSAPYLVLSYAYWKSHFDGDARVVGRTVQLDRHPFTILGVASPEFLGTELFFAPDMWVPEVNTAQVANAIDLNDRGSRGSSIVGRVKPGASAGQVVGDLSSVAAYLSKSYPKEDSETSFSVARPGLMGDMLGKPVRAFVTGLMLLAGLILLAACANLGSLFAARAADRSREIALRLALGSSRSRILRQLLTEAVMISLIGGAVGMLGGAVLLRWMSVWQPVSGFPIHLPVSPDGYVYGVSLLLAVGSGLLFGMVPVRQVLRADPYQVVKSGSMGASGRRVTARDVMLVVQIAVCAVLVTSSLVAVRGLVRSLHSNFGFVPQDALLVETDLDMGGYSGERVPAMQRRMLDAVAAIPGVTAAGLSARVPLTTGWSSSWVYRDSETDLRQSRSAAEAMMYQVAPGYFHAAETALLEGRAFTWHDDKAAPRVAIVNREFARVVLGSVPDAVGKYFKMTDGTRIEVVGVVEDGKYRSLTEDAQPAMFQPMLQSPTSATWLVVRGNGDLQELAEMTRSRLQELDGGLPFTIKTWNSELDSALFASRAATISLGVLGGLGAMLAITGIFGMASYSVSKRLRELGVRIAMGAQQREVLRAAVGRPLRLLAVGSVTGLLLGIAAARVLSSIVYEATPRDPLVLGGVVVMMLLLGLVATWVPARRALRADPLILLREE
jgi:predicted permease